MTNLQCGMTIRHSVLGIGLVTKRIANNEYPQSNDYDYFEILFEGDGLNKPRLFTNESIAKYIVPIPEGAQNMIKLNIDNEQRQYFANIFKNASKSKAAFKEITVNYPEYDKAYDELIASGLKDDEIDAEDVFVQLLIDGGTLTLIESNVNGTHELNLNKFLVAVNKYLTTSKFRTLDDLESKGSDKDNEDILQIAVFDEIYF